MRIKGRHYFKTGVPCPQLPLLPQAHQLLLRLLQARYRYSVLIDLKLSNYSADSSSRHVYRVEGGTLYNSSSCSAQVGGVHLIWVQLLLFNTGGSAAAAAAAGSAAAAAAASSGGSAGGHPKACLICCNVFPLLGAWALVPA